MTDDRLTSDVEPTPGSDSPNRQNEPIADRPWLFRPGEQRTIEAARAGGKAKHERADMLERLKEELSKPATVELVVGAKLARLLRDDSVGNRAWADLRDTLYGVPKQTLVVQRDEDPAVTLLAGLLRSRGLPSPADPADASDLPSSD